MHDLPAPQPNMDIHPDPSYTSDPWVTSKSDIVADPLVGDDFEDIGSDLADVDYMDSDDDEPELNTVELLRQGVIKTDKNQLGAPLTILLVGETGVGKSSFLELIANVLKGNAVLHYDFNILNRANEAGGSQSHSQTNAAHLYEMTSQNGQMIRILDTPGLADTRGLEQDEMHKRSIATQIQKHIDSVNAVIILANGTVPRITVGTDYALSTLSAMFPKSLANNIAFMFTNVANPLTWNFSDDTIPPPLKDAPKFLVENPIALQKRYDELKGTPKKKRTVLANMHKMVIDGEATALETLVEVFDWLDGLEPQPTTEILDLYEKSQSIEQQITNTLVAMEQAAAKSKDIRKLMDRIGSGKATMNANEYQRAVDTVVWKLAKTSDSSLRSTICLETGCFKNCHAECPRSAYSFVLGRLGTLSCHAISFMTWTCTECGHSILKHVQYRALWIEVPDTQVEIDHNMKRKWEEAKEGKERNEVAMAALQKAHDNLATAIVEGTDKLTELASEFSNLSLSGSFSAPVEKAIALYEQKLQAMRGDPSIDVEQLRQVEASLNTMKKKRALLQGAYAKAKEGTTAMYSKAKGVFVKGANRAAQRAIDYYNGAGTS
ncbi:hypothetical protein PENSPDRAFT_634475 [Peniophora sp. CONT]|nr:hypothetical protein PENSPDRAFT_634475 [Peniophora sp. CONT]